MGRRAVVDALGWRWAFFLNLPLGLIAWWRGRSRLAEWRETSGPASLDGVGIALLIAGVGALAYGIVQADVLGWRSPGVLGALAGGLVLLALFVAWARRRPDPAVDLTLFAERSNQAVRQIGSVRGVAATVAHASPRLADFRSLYLTHVALALITALLSLRIETAPPRR